MKTLLGLFLIGLTSSVNVFSGQEKTISFQDLSGNSYTNLTILAVEKDGVLFRYPQESKYVRVKFTNMSEVVQLQCGYDVQKLRRQQEEKSDNERLAREKRFAETKKQQAGEIALLAYLVRPIDATDFPESDDAKATCKELVAELKGINTGLELGMSYNKFSELLTDTAIKIQKRRDLSKDELPFVFKSRLNACIESYNSSREYWWKSIESKTESTEAWEKYFMHQAWAEAAIHLTILLGIAEGRTNVNDLVIGQGIDIVKAEKRAFADGILPIELRRYRNIGLLSEDEIRRRLKEELAGASLGSK